MCGEQIKEERCTIRKPSGAERQQIVFSDLILLYFLGLIEHVRVYVWIQHNRLKYTISHANGAYSGKKRSV